MLPEKVVTACVRYRWLAVLVLLIPVVSVGTRLWLTPVKVLQASIDRDYFSPIPTSDEDRYSEDRFERTPDRFAAADDPAIVPASEASFMRDTDEVLGFVINGQARAYSIRSIGYHHIINDTLGDCHLAVTY